MAGLSQTLFSSYDRHAGLLGQKKAEFSPSFLRSPVWVSETDTH